MIKELNIRIIDKMRAGSGDIVDLHCNSMFHFRDPQELNMSIECVRATEDQYGTIHEDNRTLLDFEVNPGFFHMGDKEYHLYSQKITDVAYVTSKQEAMTLKEYPNGYSHIGLYGPFAESDFSGIFHTELIKNGKTMHSYYLNEANRFARWSGESGFDPTLAWCTIDESGFYPLCFSPFWPVSQCYTYWEPENYCKPRNYLDYDYNLFTNSVDRVLENFTEEEAGYYIVEYERTTLKALTGTSYNPVSRVVSPGFLTITHDLTSYDAERVNILSISEPGPGGRITISFEIRDFLNNIVSETSVDMDITRVFKDKYEHVLTYTIEDYNEYYTIYRFETVSEADRIIYEHGANVGVLKAFQDVLILKTEGLISSSSDGDFGYDTTIQIGENGMGLAYFLVPSVPARESEVDLVLTYLGIEMKKITIRNGNTVLGVAELYSETDNYIYTPIEIYSRSGSEVTINVEGLQTLTGLSIYTIKNYAEYEGMGVELKPLRVIRYTLLGNIIRIYTIMAPDDGDYVVVQNMSSAKNYIKMDSSGIYGL